MTDKQVIENTKEIIVTEAMIDAGVSLLDDWLCRNLTEMYKEGHTGFGKRQLVNYMLSESISQSRDNQRPKVALVP